MILGLAVFVELLTCDTQTDGDTMITYTALALRRVVKNIQTVR